jgi:CheY-like chemotaxis protein
LVKGRRILFQDPDPRILRTAERALIATGAEVDVIQAGQVTAGHVQAAQAVAGRVAAVVAGAPQPAMDERELLRRIERGNYDLLMLNFDPPARADPRWSEVFDYIGARLPACRVVLHATAPSEDYLPLLAERRFVRNLIAKNNEPLEPEELITTAEKLLRGDLFGLEKYLLWGVCPIKIAICDSRDKHGYVREVATFAKRLGINERTVGQIESIADELITNVIYNAPRDERGRPRYAMQSRRQPVALEPHEQGSLEFASDGNYIAISASDPFGSLTQDAIVSYLNRCLVTPMPLLGDAASSGGAGIGLYRVFQSLSKFIVNIDPGRRTEVITLIDLRVNMKKFRQTPKSFHIFIADRPEVNRA